MLEQDNINQVKCVSNMYNIAAGLDVNDTLYELRDHLTTFLLFLDTETTVQDFLAYDRCFIYADKYLLAIIFSYFTRAGFNPKHEYTPYAFFLALYLAQEMEEEDNELIKDELYIWALGIDWKTHVKTFEKDKMDFFVNLGYKTTVSRSWCEELFGLAPESSVWRRTRATAHAGARQKVVREVDGEFKPPGSMNVRLSICPQLFGLVPESSVWRRTRATAHAGARQKVVREVNGEFIWVHRIKGVCWKCADSMEVGSCSDTRSNSSSETETSSPNHYGAFQL